MVKKSVQSRQQTFAKQITTVIWREIPAADNPYLTQEIECCGYAQPELLAQCSLVQMLYLSLTGELPSTQQARLFEALWKACFNPGPRHPAVQAVFNAAASKAQPVHLLPIGLMLLGGEQEGALAVQRAMAFLQPHRGQTVAEVAVESFSGFGHRFGSADPVAARMLAYLDQHAPADSHLGWLSQLQAQRATSTAAVQIPAVIAAALLDLGFSARQAPGLVQLLYLPGLLAHSLEAMTQQITDLPFVADEEYQIDGRF